MDTNNYIYAISSRGLFICMRISDKLFCHPPKETISHMKENLSNFVITDIQHTRINTVIIDISDEEFKTLEGDDIVFPRGDEYLQNVVGFSANSIEESFKFFF